MGQKPASIGSRVIIIATVVILAALLGIMVAQRFNLMAPASPQLADGTILQPPRPVPPFSLVDQHNQPFTEASLRGHWSLIFFGYTNCPDVCPVTLSTLAGAGSLLKDLDEGKQPHVVFVTVDPERDTPEKLAAYVGYFDPGFTGVTGSTAEIDRLTRALGVPVGRTPLPNGGYSVDHSASLFVIEPNGGLRALLAAPHAPASVAADYRHVVADAGV